MLCGNSFDRLSRHLIFTGRKLAVKTSSGYEITMLFSSYFKYFEWIAFFFILLGFLLSTRFNLYWLYSWCCQIHLDKRVPTGAGLGGGSSNAATALWAANQFSGCLATEKELQEWSSEIGSDIPFFFSQGAAYCTGRGEVSPNIRYQLFWKLDMRKSARCSLLIYCYILLCGCSMCAANQ